MSNGEIMLWVMLGFWAVSTPIFIAAEVWLERRPQRRFDRWMADLYTQTGADAAVLLKSESVSETVRSAVLAEQAVRARAAETLETRPSERIEPEDN